MARLTIDTGTEGNKATGDSLRSAFTKINDNFGEVYSLFGDGSTGLITTDVTNGNIKVQPNGTGSVEIDQLAITGDNITSLITNGTVNITGQATGGVKIEEILFEGSSLSSTDSTIININDGVVIDGPLTVNGEFVLNDLVVGTLNVDNLNFNDNVISSDSNADILLSPGGTGSVQASGIAIRGTTISADDSTAININESLIVDGTATVSGALSSATSLVLATGATVTGIADEDDMTSNSATLLSTQQSIKAYVDATVTAQDLDFQGDSGGALSIDLDSETLDIAGGTGIDTTGSSNTLTVAIDATVATLADSQTLTNKSIDFDNNTITNIEVDNLKSGVLDTDLTAVAGTDTTLASAKSIKTYVDAQVTAQDLDIRGDTGGALSIDLDSETLRLTGGTGIDTVGSGETITFNINSTVATLTDTQTLTNKTLNGPTIINATISEIITNAITSNGSNADISIQPSGSGDVILSGIRINGTTLDSSDSSSININEGLIVDGTATFSGAVTITSGTITGITDLTVADGGTGASTFTDGGILLGSGTGAITAMTALSDGEMIVGDGSTDPVAESGATLRTSIGVGTGDSPQFTGIELGAATDTTITRASAGDLNIEGNIIYRAGGTDVPVADGGTGASSLTDNAVLTGTGTSAITAEGNLSFNGSTLGVTGSATVSGTITLATQTQETSGTVTVASSSASVLDSFATATFRSAKYIVSINNTANTRFETAELLVVHDGTNSFIHSSGVSSSGDSMATYTTDINSGNVRILVVPQSADSTVYKFKRTLIVV